MYAYILYIIYIYIYIYMYVYVHGSSPKAQRHSESPQTFLPTAGCPLRLRSAPQTRTQQSSAGHALRPLTSTTLRSSTRICLYIYIYAHISNYKYKAHMYTYIHIHIHMYICIYLHIQALHLASHLQLAQGGAGRGWHGHRSRLPRWSDPFQGFSTGPLVLFMGSF